MARQRRMTPRKVDLFLETLRRTCSVQNAAKLAKVSRSTVYLERTRNPDFAQAWDEALDEGLDLLEYEVIRRAFKGIDAPVFYKGVQVGTTRKYSDKLAMFMLKALRPERYRSRVVIGATNARAKSLRVCRSHLDATTGADRVGRSYAQAS